MHPAGSVMILASVRVLYERRRDGIHFLRGVGVVRNIPRWVSKLPCGVPAVAPPPQEGLRLSSNNINNKGTARRLTDCAPRRCIHFRDKFPNILPRAMWADKNLIHFQRVAFPKNPQQLLNVLKKYTKFNGTLQ